MPFIVEIIESESGWGQKLDGIRGFRTEQAAKNYITKYNASNNLPYVPDWYMYARMKDHYDHN
jgi:hypothetical protein